MNRNRKPTTPIPERMENEMEVDSDEGGTSQVQVIFENIRRPLPPLSYQGPSSAPKSSSSSSAPKSSSSSSSAPKSSSSSSAPKSSSSSSSAPKSSSSAPKSSSSAPKSSSASGLKVSKSTPKNSVASKVNVSQEFYKQLKIAFGSSESFNKFQIYVTKQEEELLDAMRKNAVLEVKLSKTEEEKEEIKARFETKAEESLMDLETLTGELQNEIIGLKFNLNKAKEETKELKLELAKEKHQVQVLKQKAQNKETSIQELIHLNHVFLMSLNELKSDEDEEIQGDVDIVDQV